MHACMQVDLNSDPNNCGRCGNSCRTANVRSATCSSGVCTQITCEDNFANCDGDVSNGCETAAGTCQPAPTCVPAVCQNAFAALNRQGACNGDTCEQGQCVTGFENCNEDNTDGCEVRRELQALRGLLVG
jgi:hypothetical protein